jgi:hypothetical protein
MKRGIVGAIVISSVFTTISGICGESPIIAAHSQPKVQVIRAARMLDVRSGKMVKPAVVVIEKGRIKAVNPRRVPDKAKLIELGDRTRCRPEVP